MTNFVGGMMPVPPIKAIGKTAGDAAKSIGQSGGGGAGGAGYEFSPEEIDAVLRQWEDLYADLITDVVDAQRVAGVQAPGNEPASQTFVSAVNPAGVALMQQTEAMADHVGQYVEALRQAKESIQTREDEAVQNVSNAGNGVS